MAQAAKAWDVPLRTLAAYVSGESDPKISFLETVAASELVDISYFFSYGETSEPELFLKIPLRDVFASAGGGAQNENENIIGTLPFPKAIIAGWGRSIAQVEAIRVRGDSMEPTIQEGDFILLDKAERQMKEGRIYVITAPDGLLLKRFQRHVDGSVMLTSDNAARYAPLRLSAAELSTLNVAGRAFWAGGMI